MTSPTSEADWRCSSWSRLEGLDPIGTVGSYLGYLLIEWPLPWPRDVSDIDELKPVCDAARKRDIRVQAVVSPTPGPHRRVLYYKRPAMEPGPFQQGCRERAVAPEDVVAVALDLITSPEPTPTAASGIRDVLICTHGSRDRCCGKLGARLAIDANGYEDSDALVRVWRTSHTGGHRFAPTVLVLPEATGWAYVDTEILSRIVNRRGHISEVSAHYRGTAWLDGSSAQTLERAVLEELGWPLLSMPRSSVTSQSVLGDRTEVQTALTVQLPNGGLHTWSGAVGRREVSLPNCGEPARGSMATYEEYRVLSPVAIARSES